ncbi:hypothetical protein ACYSNM_01615 [Myroides sp. LJL116]
MKKRYLFILPALALLASCEPDIKDGIDGGTYYAGEADFSTYVAIGNSLTAGYMDGTVFKSGQQYSFPNILAGQFKVVGGREFTQPSFEDDVNNVGGLLLGGQVIAPTRLIMNMSTSSPENIKGTITIEVSNQQKKAFHNAGVPGAKSFHLLAKGYGSLAGVANGTANPYFVRTATSENASVIEDAMSLNPTFFTNWIGSNDVLGYASSGGDGVDQNELNGLDPSLYGPNDITHVGVFQNVYQTITQALVQNGAKGAIATIPDVTAIPYFTTVPYNPLTPELIGVEKIDALNTFVGMLKEILAKGGQADRLEFFSKDKANALLIQDKTLADMSGLLKLGLKQASDAGLFVLTDQQIAMLSMVYGQARHATSKDLFILTSKSQIGLPMGGGTGNPTLDALLVNGVSYPMSDSFVLNPVEQKKVKLATDSFNAIIKAEAVKHNLALVDMNAILNQAVSGLRVEDGQIYTADYFQGMGNLNTVMFSLDGVHLNPRGYAFASSEILKVINQHYKANIPLVNPAKYPGPTLLPTN